MDVKQFLKQIRSEQTEIELLLLKKNNIILIRALKFTADKVQASSDKDLSDYAIKNGALLNALDKKINEFHKNQLIAYDLINSLENDNQRKMMLMYYLTRKDTGRELTRPYSLEEVADELNYSSSYIRHLHGSALEALRKKAPAS